MPSAARCWSCTATATASSPTPTACALAELLGVGLVTARGRRPPAVPGRPGAVQPARPRVRGLPRRHARAAEDVEPGAAPSPPRALRLVADRAGARPARHRDRRRAAGAPTGPGDRLAGPAPDHGAARRACRAGTPGVALPGERERAHRVGGRGARPARLPGLPADGRDPARQLHGLPRPRHRRAVRPGRRRRGLGPRLLPAREPRAQAQPLRVADRLRRVVADGRRWTGRGRADRGLQRGDGGAGRALPGPAGPVDLRRRPGRPGAPTRWVPGCPACGTGPRRTSTSPAT